MVRTMAQRGDQRSEDAPLSVSAALALAKGSLESIVVTILGEVSEVSAKAGYKAVYFTVKDDRCALPCMMWNNRYRASGVDLTVGSMVEINGRFSLYAAKGRMNFEVVSLEVAGEGRLRMAVAALAKALAAEGLMDAARKRPLPAYPETIGIVTSPRGAVVHDMLRTLRRRYPLARVLFAGVPVEGADAPKHLIEGLRTVAAGGAEVILIGRGGGSFEDLMPFNDEALARAIAGCPVPVISGIGHEPDTTIADLAADVRASTPTAAAEAVAPDARELGATLRLMARRIAGATQARLTTAQTGLVRIALNPMFQDAAALFSEVALDLDDLSIRLHQALPSAIDGNRRRINACEIALRGDLRHGLAPFKNAAAAAAGNLRLLGPSLLARFAQPIAQYAAQLEALSPLSVLTRGYAIATTPRGRILRSTASVKPGDEVVVSVADGELDCEVIQTRPRLPGAEYQLTYSDRR